MSEAPASSRRRERGRAHPSPGPPLAPLPRLENRWPPLEVLSSEQVERILLAAFRILEEAGLEIRSAAARAGDRGGGVAGGAGRVSARRGAGGRGLADGSPRARRHRGAPRARPRALRPLRSQPRAAPA